MINMKMILVILSLLILMTGCINAATGPNASSTNTTQIIKSLNNNGDCDNDPPGSTDQMCLLKYNIEGYGVCSFMLSDGVYSGGPTLIGCKP